MIDLHSHTNESDGTYSPEELVREAARIGIRTLAITDHDTFAGFDQAVPFARSAGLELICGIELSTKLSGQSVHLLGYFFENADLTSFRTWILDMQASRRDRNIRLIARLRELGIDISLEEAERRGRGMTGRPHFAQIMLEKGYVSTLQQAFDEYLAEEAKGYVYRREPQFAEGVERIRKAGGVASFAHPVRYKGDFAAILPELCAAGMNAIEAYHSDHEPKDTDFFLRLANRHGLIVTGGSDFHGANKPDIRLGTGKNNNVCVPDEVMRQLRAKA
jgi:predicted metal-dependent phosphoesterase TrpH